MKIIGFAGVGRSGKTTLAHDLCAWLINETSDHTPVYLPFAQPLKEFVAAHNGFSCAAQFKNEQPDKYREECQALGRRAREKDPMHWVNEWLEVVESYRHAEENTPGLEYVIIVDDVRYMNEVEKVQELDGQVFFIAHGGREIEDMDGAWREHDSEDLANGIEKDWSTGVALMNGWVYNTGSLKEYLETCSEVYHRWLGLDAESIIDED